MSRRTKIVATLGPATDDPAILEQVLRAGVDVVRINFSHGVVEEHRERVRMVRETAERIGKTVGVLGDLQGPKIRIERFENESVMLIDGQQFCIDSQIKGNAGNEQAVGVSYKQLVHDVKRGDVLLLDDGNIALLVESVEDTKICTRVQTGGKLSNNKGINLKDGGLSAGALTSKDREDILLAAELDVDFLAISFVRTGEDVEEARRLLKQQGTIASIVAKVERKEAVDNIDDIIAAADVVMVARGDLGVEIGDANVPGVQKRIIRRARERNRVVITATQMMQSMVEHPIPTRAEVSDVANAVLDNTDAVMLSAETAVGQYPVKVVEAMDRVCRASEMQVGNDHQYQMKLELGNAEEAIAMSAMYAASHFSLAAILAITESGRTALLMSRINDETPIYAMTRNKKAAHRMSLYRGVQPVSFDITTLDAAGINRGAAEILREQGLVAKGEQIIITRGDGSVEGFTNTMKIVRVGEVALH